MSKSNPIQEEFIYKIFNPTTGKYSSGSVTPTWNNTGKAWSLGHLNSHLAQFYDSRSGMLNNTYPYDNCQVVKVKVTQENTEVIDCDLHVATLRLRRLAGKK